MRPLPVLRALFTRLTTGRLTPWVKQIPTVVTFVVALAVLFVTRMPVSSWPLVWTSIAGIAAGTVVSIALPWRRIPTPWSILIPCASIAAIALLRLATGGGESAFGVLLIIPVIWIASEPGAWNPLIAGVGTGIALLAPALSDPHRISLDELARDLLTPFVFLVAAVIINEVARRVREAAEERDRVKDEFLGLVSHELRNPLTSVLGFLELLTMSPDPLTEAQRGYIDIAQRNAKRLQGLVGDLLATAQAGEGAFTLQTGPVDLGDIVSQSVASARPAAEAADVSLEAVREASAPLDGDAVRLGQAVDNLISNALKFTPAGGTVTVTAGMHGADAAITVRDTGVGIPPEELEHLSERFYRATTAQHIPGIGLGLTVVRQIATAHGGRLDVDSVEGQGTTFTLVLPVRAGS